MEFAFKFQAARPDYRSNSPLVGHALFFPLEEIAGKLKGKPAKAPRK